MYKSLSLAAVDAYRSKNKEAARKLVSDPECSAPALYAAAHVLLGVGWEAWLLETVCHELQKEGLPEHHEDLIGALQAVASTGAPWWSFEAFCATADAFAHMPVAGHAYDPPEPHHMAALVPEMTLVFALATATDPENFHPTFSDEVEAYVAAALAHHGYCCAPPTLEFAHSRLEKLCHGHTCERHKKAADVSEGKATSAPPSDNIQTHRYEEIVEYVKQRLKRCEDALKTLRP